MIGAFFKGLPIMGYVLIALVVIILGEAGVIKLQSNRLDNLNKELGASATAIEQLIAANGDNQVAIVKLENAVLECVGQRNSAAKAANLARQELARNTRDAYIKSDERRDEIERIVENSERSDDDDCECVVPSRAAGLLIEAACSANRGTNCP